MSDAPSQEANEIEKPLSVGQRIKARREEKQMSLSLLADRAGISKSYLHDIENSPNVRPSGEVLHNIAEVLGTTSADLLGKRRTRGGGDKPLQVPESLEEFARKYRISEDDKRLLAGIKYRNKQPKSVEDWRYLLDTIRRVIDPTDC